MTGLRRTSTAKSVVLLAEDVDRNYSTQNALKKIEAVVLLAEDVDRNLTRSRILTSPGVVLLAEDVDRNTSW